MNYSRYKLVRDIALEILIQENIRELPVKPIALSRSMGIEAVYDENTHGKADGYCTILQGVSYIAIDPEINRQQRRFTVAHELGHLLLGHIDPDYITIFRGYNEINKSMEMEADLFAAILLAPPCVLQSLEIYDAAEIMNLCDCEFEEAESYAEYIKKLASKKSAALPLESIVLEQFQDFINSRRGVMTEKRTSA